MEKRSGLSELSVISWVSAIEGCPLSGAPLYTVVHAHVHVPVHTHIHVDCMCNVYLHLREGES